MTRPLLALALLAAPAYADTCAFGPGDIATRATLQPHDEAFAVVVLDNKLAARDRSMCDLTLYGVTVRVFYDSAQGSAPDWFHVHVPPGFVADPPSVLVADGARGQVLIWISGGLGS
jgi:hypothetical protein